MTSNDRLEARLTAGLTDLAGTSTPGFHNDILAATARTRQRPAWSYPERWFPMAVITRPATAPPPRLAWLLLAALLALALAAGGAIVGTRLLTSSLPAVVAVPQGAAGVYAFDSNGDIFTVRADGTDLRQLTSGPDIESSPAWSPDGTRIAYRVWSGDTHTRAPGAGPISWDCTHGCYAVDSVAVMDAGGGHRRTLAHTGHPSGCVGTWFPAGAWSPDGTSLIFPASPKCDGRFDLQIVAADGSAPATKLLGPGLESRDPAWSPDGTRIAFQGREGADSPGLYVADVGVSGALAGGLAAHRITGTASYSNDSWLWPHWSPDGTQLLAAAGTGDPCAPAASGAWDIYVARADGSGGRYVLDDPASEFNPSWSPDGTHIAFQRTVPASEIKNGQACTNRVWVTAADGSDAVLVDGPLTDGVNFGWSPDGTRLVGNWVDVTPGDDPSPNTFYFFTADGSVPPVSVDAPNTVGPGSWLPVDVPLPPAPSFPAASPGS